MVSIGLYNDEGFRGELIVCTLSNYSLFLKLEILQHC